MKRVLIWSNFLLISCAFVAFYACRSAVNVTTEDVPEGVRDFQASVVSDSELSQITRQYMRTHGLDPSAAEDPTAFLSALRQTEDDDAITKVHALAEYALSIAKGFDDVRTERPSDWYLLCAEQAFQQVFLAARAGLASWDLRSGRLRDFYQVALAGFVSSQWKQDGALASHARVIFGKKYSISISEGEHLLDPNEFEQPLLAYELQFEGADDDRRTQANVC